MRLSVEGRVAGLFEFHWWNATAVALDGQHDENYPVAKLRVAVNPGASVNVTVDIVAVKPGKKTLDAIVTPMVHASAVDRPVLDCATVPAG